MFFKSGDKARELYKSDPLWAVVLSQLKSQTLGLTPYFRAGDIPSSRPEDQTLGYQRFETILSQIEDGYNLNNLLILKRSKLRNVRLNQICEDISENYNRRFSGLSECRVLMLVERNLPPIKTHPAVVMQVVDCLMRAAQRLSSEKGAQLAIEAAANQRGPEVSVRLKCCGLQLGVEEKRIKQSLAKFKAGKYADSVNDFGIDICAAFHLASQLGAAIDFQPAAAGGIDFAVDFKFERSDEAPRPEPEAGPFYLLSRSEQVRSWIGRLAEFHGVEMRHCNSAAELPAGSKLVYDALSGVAPDQLAREADKLPQSTVFLSAASEMPVIGKATGGRFKQLTMPVTSTKLLRTLFADPQAAANAGGAEAKTVRPLRVLVVDDTETARIAIQDYLESKGHTVVEACDGSEFIDRIRNGEVYDLAICDLNMVHVDGAAAAKAVREIERSTGRSIKIVLMTAFKAAELEEPSAIGVNAILDKPVLPADLDRIIAEFF